MAYSRARHLSKILLASGRVKRAASNWGDGSNAITLANLPTITNAKLDNSSLTINSVSTALGTSADENIQDLVGAMFTGNTETGVTVTYQDSDGTIDLVIGTLNQNTTGSAATLTTARTIGGVSFDGSTNINLPGVNAAGNQNTSGLAATATLAATTTALATARTIGGVSFDGTANINLPGVNAAGTQTSTGLTGSPAISTGTITSTGGLSMAVDNSTIYLGAGLDLRLYHDGSHSYIKNTYDSGALKLVSNDFRVENTAARNQLKTGVSGAVQLFYDTGSATSVKLATASTGVAVTGIVTATSFTGNLTGNLLGTPTAPTAAANTNTTQVATTAYVQTELTDLINGAPGTLDTLNELAAAINDDANYNSTLTTALATKMPLAGGTFTGDIQSTGVYVGSTNTSYDFYNNGTTYLNGGTIIDDFLDLTGGSASLKIAGTQIIDASRNMSNMGNITSAWLYTGGITATSHINVPTGYSFQWGDTHERIEQSDGKIEFFTGNSEKMTLSGASLGIGQPVPESTLHLRDTSSNAIVQTTWENDARKWRFGVHGGLSDSMNLYDETASASRFTVTSVGNVGIGTTTPYLGTNVTSLTVNAVSYPTLALKIGDVSKAVIMATSAGLDIYANDNKTLRLHTNDTPRLTVTGTGNVGIGVTPETWTSDYTALQIGGGSSLFGHTTGGGEASNFLGQNVYHNSGWKYINTNEASNFQQKNGAFYFNSAASGSADATISFTTKMTIASDGKVTIGSAAVSQAQLNIVGTNSGTNPAANAHNASSLQLYNNSNTDGAFSGLDFYNKDDLIDSRIAGVHANQSSRHGDIAFLTHNGTSLATRMTLKADGVVETTGDIKPGADVIMASGRGINFSATANSSGTMASETLDDYEEGTWTPVLTGSTAPTGGQALSPSGSYTKIGNRVFVHFYVGRSWTNSPSGIMFITGLPYTVNASGNGGYLPCITYNILYGDSGTPFVILTGGNTTFSLYAQRSGSTWHSMNWETHPSSSGSYVTGTFSYVV